MSSPESHPIGYQWLAERFGIVTLPYWRESRTLVKGSRRLVETDGHQVEYLPAVQHPGEEACAHLEFALRKEGLHLELLRSALLLIPVEEVTAHVASKPTGRYARLIWWLYEEFAGELLDLPDARTGNYVDLLDPELYVTGTVRKAKRQRVNVNLLGTSDFSPMVRRQGLGAWNESDLQDRCREIVSGYPPEIFQRAVRFLYAKESKSSHAIERETPDQKRAEIFISLLEQAWHREFLDKEALVELQKAIVDPRYANDGWRSEIGEQIYVGESLAPNVERVHYAAPKPEDLEGLMEQFLIMARRMAAQRESVPTLVAAAVISFAFNFLHPFSDGNGRIHRFLLHHVLARRGFGPEGIILPVSAVILNRPREYDQALESFSKPLMRLVEYTLDDRQRMTVTNETADHYRYIDCTRLTWITAGFVRETIETELPAELRYLAMYDEIRSGMRGIVELPDRIADLFVKLVRQNGGTLSQTKRKLPEFARLTDGEIAAMETVIRARMEAPGSEETS